MNRSNRASMLLSLFVATASGVATAQPVPDASQSQPPVSTPASEAEYARGDAMRAEHRDADAVTYFQALYARAQEPRTLAQLGLAEAALGRWLDAEAHLIEALTALRDPWITHNRASLLATLEAMRTHIGTLVVTSDVEPAEVWINRRRVGSTGAPLHVLAGDVAFEARVEGRSSVARTVSVAPNAIARESVRFSLDDAASDPAVQRPVSAPAASAAQGITRNDPGVARDEASSSGGTRRALGWAAVGTGAALVVGGVAAWFLGRGAADAYNNDPTCPGVGAPTQSDTCASAQSTAATLEPIAWVAGGLGVALAVTGAALVATSGDGRTPSVARRCGPVVGPWTGVSCGLAF